MKATEGLLLYILPLVLTVEEVQVIHFIEHRLMDVLLCLVLSTQPELIYVDKTDLHYI